MNVPFNCEVAWRVTCSVCGKQEGEFHKIFSGGEPPYPSLPDMWNVLNGLPICNAHVVKVVCPEFKSHSLLETVLEGNLR